MPTLAALALATPVWGFALSAPRYAAPNIIPATVPQVAEASEPTAQAAEAATDENLRHQLDTRRTMADWMTGLGIATWVGMATTLVLGAVHFHDQYGLGGSFDETPCAQGTGVMQEFCEGTVWPHAIAAGTTIALYVTTSMLGWFMPDPLGASEQPGPHGDRIRFHRSWRWVTSSLIIAQALLGFFISHADWFGLDQKQDFDVMQGLSATHLALGVAALGSFTVQGAVMLF
jgi:hypothetical protein